ncbi:MAG: glycosyltransferase family 2 protein [Aulosira sp. ZfuCHP01]|nr:glycosyltransferase family 2 protein [Aulosira sp. ZfuVER01]MDZ8052239.1 glycosyltransferase family 2 protein [Aulosira sp. ZfuCHP01]
MDLNNNMFNGLLSKLPPPPDGKSGFPWNQETENLSNSELDIDFYPKISIITPSYNQGQFLEETIRSVILQNYPNLEYIIIDGGSTDNSIEIIQKYANYLSYWVSEKDNGQSHAINKGLKKVSGDIWAYINSDDRYEKGTFQKVAAQFKQDSSIYWVTGYAEYINEIGVVLERLIPSAFSGVKEALIRWEGPIRGVAIQVSNFMSTKILKNYGFFDESLHYCMDSEFNMRLLVDNITPKIIPDVLAQARLHSQSKTVSKGRLGLFREEDFQIIPKFLPKLSIQDQIYVKHKISECKFFMDLRKVASFYETRQVGKFITETSRMLVQHPSYLSHRATWGMFRQALGLTKTRISH